MALDFFILAIIAAATFLGYRKGFAAQIVAFAAIVAVYFFSTPLAAVVRIVAFQERDVTFPGIEVASLVIAAIIIFIGAWMVGRLFTALITSISEKVDTLDSVLGAVLGFVKAFLVVYLTLCVLVYAESPLSSAFPSLGDQMKSSFTVAGARSYNVITFVRYPELSDMRDAMVAAEDQAEKPEADRDETYVKLLSNEKFREVVMDKDLMTAAKDRDYSTLLSDERVLELLADEDFQEVVTDTDWEDMIDE